MTVTKLGVMGIVNDLTAATNRRDIAAFGEYYVTQKSKLLRDFDKTLEKYGRRILARRYGDELEKKRMTRNSRKVDSEAQACLSPS